MAKRLDSTAPPVGQSKWRESTHPAEATMLAVAIGNLLLEGDSSVYPFAKLNPAPSVYYLRMASKQSYESSAPVLPQVAIAEFLSTDWILAQFAKSRAKQRQVPGIY